MAKRLISSPPDTFSVDIPSTDGIGLGLLAISLPNINYGQNLDHEVRTLSRYAISRMGQGQFSRSFHMGHYSVHEPKSDACSVDM
jgi:hypothetical protein